MGTRNIHVIHVMDVQLFFVYCLFVYTTGRTREETHIPPIRGKQHYSIPSARTV